MKQNLTLPVRKFEKLQNFQFIANCDITFYRILRYLYNVFSHLRSKKQFERPWVDSNHQPFG